MAVFNQELANKRLGEQAQMKNGQQATIITYRGATDIDIQFEDGTVVPHRAYSEWNRREIRNPNYTPPYAYREKVLGETRIMSNGMSATVVVYRTSTDIDIQFSDGTIRQHVRYNHFKTGKVNPLGSEGKKALRLGEERVMNCGFKCKIIEYFLSNNITVQFEDGIVLKKKNYNDFSRGLIQHPGIYSHEVVDGRVVSVPAEDRIGAQKIMKNGLKAVVIGYTDAAHIDVQFEDGAIRKNVEWRNFQGGGLSHPSELPEAKSQVRIGESKKMKNGHVATIVRYGSWQDLDVKFDDGTVVGNQRYEKFIKGEIPHPKIKYKTAMSLQEFAINYYLQHLGFRKIQQGEWEDKGFGRLEVDFYNEESNVAIEYDGAIHNKPGTDKRELRKNQCCANNGITLYRLRDPYCKKIVNSSAVNYVLQQDKKVISGLIDCKQELEQILQNHNISFETTMIDFTRDKDVILQEYNNTYINYYSKQRLGQVKYNSRYEQKMTIIAYRDATHIDVQFEDGAIRKDVTYRSFQTRNIAHPARTRSVIRETRLGEQMKMKNGQQATIIAYRNARDINIQFEDGSVREHVAYATFVKGLIK